MPEKEYTHLDYLLTLRWHCPEYIGIFRRFFEVINGSRFMELSKVSILEPNKCRLRVLFLVFFGILFFSGSGAAECNEEMDVLRMFFSEKNLFSSATRNAKPISQIAENVTIVTAKDIEAMNAHSVAEILNRVTGVFVNFSQGAGSLGSTSLLHILGSEDAHVLVVVDGIPLNSLASGAAETNRIPVGIIDRIEIIKGPASSSWGSSLGGLVHIITKSPGYTTGPTGSIRASYGERDTQDYRAQVSGRSGRFGYYLFGGRQESDGFDRRYFETNNLYSKFTHAVSDRIDVTVSLGYGEPDMKLGDYESLDFTQTVSDQNFWGTGLLDVVITRDLTFKLRLFRYEQKADIESRALDTTGPEDPLQESVYDEQTTGASAILTWQKGNHTAVVGMDYEQGELEQDIVPPGFHTDPDLEKTGIYINDTIVFHRWSITPGLRYDHNNLTGAFISPSLGLTYRFGHKTMFRGSLARGFTTPPLSWISGGALFLEPNPSLEHERVWSYQAGVESAASRYFWFKAAVFRHEIDNIFTLSNSDSPSRPFIFFNEGDSRRQGLELEIETLPFYNFSVRGGWAYVDISPSSDSGAEQIYTYNVCFAYDNPDIVQAELFGHYIWWDADSRLDAEYDDFIWDLSVNKRVYAGKKIGADLFFTCRNLFNGSQYLIAENKNTERWVEAGFKLQY